jgi:hypothetical protein
MPSVRPIVRLLWRDRSVTAIAVAILALGLGANVALFAVVNAVLLKRLPYPASDRLVLLRVIDPAFADRYPSFPANAMHIAAWRRDCRSCDALASIIATSATLTGDGDPEQLDGASVSPGFFDLLGIAPVLGRGFVSDDARPGSERVAMLSHAIWMQRFGGDPSIIGRAIQLNRKPSTVIGVLPQSARLPGPGESRDGVLRCRAWAYSHDTWRASGPVYR